MLVGQAPVGAKENSPGRKSGVPNALPSARWGAKPWESNGSWIVPCCRRPKRRRSRSVQMKGASFFSKKSKEQERK